MPGYREASGLDANIAMGVRPPEIQGPLDIAIRGQTLKGLTQQTDAVDRQTQTASQMNDIMKSNMTTDAQGNPTVNRQAALSDMAKVNPMQAMSFKHMFENQDMEKMQQMSATAKNLAWSATPDNWGKIKEQAIAANLPSADKLPDVWTQSVVDNWKMHTLSAEEQLQQHLADQKMQQHSQDLREAQASRLQIAQMGRENKSGDRQDSAAKHVGDMLQNARSSDPAVQQAEKDLYATRKVDSMVNLYGDPNKLAPPQVQLLATEVAKIASGGVPTMHELQGLNPSAIPSSLAALAQKASNEPESANAGKFVRAMQDYTNSLKKDAQDIIKEKYGRVLETNRKQMGDEHYNNYKAQYMDRFKNDTPQLSAEDKQAIQWANSNPKDPRAQQILQIHGASAQPPTATAGAQ